MAHIRRIAALALAFVLIAGCQAAAPAPEQDLVFTAEVPSPTATAAVATASPTAAPEATPVGDTPTPRPNIQATVAALAGAVTFTPPTPPAGVSGEPITADDYVGLFEQGWRIVRDNYVRDDFNGVDWDAIRDRYLPRAQAVSQQSDFWTLMEELLRELKDDHSRFVRPDRFAAEFDLTLTQPNQGSGLLWTGMTIWPAREDERLLIWDVCEVGAAASAGLRRGDVILAIDGRPIERGAQGFDQDQYRPALVGTGAVTLTVWQGPDNEPTDVRLQYGGGGGCDGWVYGLLSETPRVSYVRIYDFGGESDTRLFNLIREMEAEAPLDGLILDVRHNPGGNSDRDIAIFTTGTFGMVGPLRQDATRTIYRIRGPVRWNETTPVVVLIDGASHSAAEYFATAMQQSGRAILVGQPTAGNTEGINSWNLADGSIIRLAWMTLELPDGSTLEEVGVQPDVVAPLGEWGLRQQPDAQLMAAYEVILDEIP